MAQNIPTYKLILLGDLDVGKTSFYLRLKHGTFVERNHTKTDEFPWSDRLEYTHIVDETTVKAYLYDTGGMEQHRTLTSSFYRDSAAILLFYSVDSQYTFEHLPKWVDDAEDILQRDSQLTWALIGNKCDLLQEVSEQPIQAFLRDRLKTDLSFYVSAKSGENVKNAIEAIITAVHRKRLQQHGFAVTEKNSTLKLNLISKPPAKCSC